MIRYSLSFVQFSMHTWATLFLFILLYSLVMLPFIDDQLACLYIALSYDN
jgi:hypothetical protein